MRKITLPKHAKKVFESSMPKALRKAYKNGAEIHAVIERKGRPLYRWGSSAEITVRKNIIKSNSLVDFAWNWDENKAIAEAVGALDYLVYGDSTEFIIKYHIV